MKNHRIKLFIIKNPLLQISQYAEILNTSTEIITKNMVELNIDPASKPDDCVGIAKPKKEEQYNSLMKGLRLTAKSIGMMFKQLPESMKWGFYRAGRLVSTPYRLVDWKCLHEKGEILSTIDW